MHYNVIKSYFPPCGKGLPCAKKKVKTIVLFGAGKSASVLIDYILNESEKNDWQLIVADSNKDIIESKTHGHKRSKSIVTDITDTHKRRELIATADIVISMMPASLHFLIAEDCISLSKHLLTASYVDDKIKSLDKKAKEAGILFLCEMGLDPGIDHMSAMKIFDEINADGGKIFSFKSHCGGLVAPESDDNPWHYKISWNPRNVILAGKAGATYLLNNKTINEPYENLFANNNELDINGQSFGYYPNRDSLSYIQTYNLKNLETFIRTTLRMPEFMQGWDKIIKLKLTDEQTKFATEGLSFAKFYSNHFETHGLQENFKMLCDELFLSQINYLGYNDDSSLLNIGEATAADVMQFIVEKKLMLLPTDKDLVVMVHEVEFEKDNKKNLLKSILYLKGNNSIHTAMAKTVGLPLGIAANLILNGKINLTGVHIPVKKEIYIPVLQELEKFDVRFEEQLQQIS